ncbi:hypothetical protein DVA86_03300 [Streptomyces armeniacus]|uniref:DUF1023 domain-containing protein n=1 Tax=Streptomyces armeniacus TaxID=83291 RepID=A0A345XJK0_9ACTN|nr:alpha/beta hydrolase [Streptomyces armeniacus]AXK31816.1 hypothetical protein DVA86_03300 [Streptomyces armeniacus]
MRLRRERPRTRRTQGVGASADGRTRRTRRSWRTPGRVRSRLRRGLLAALIAVAVVVPLSGAGHAGTPAPVPPRLPAVTADSLPSRYAAGRDAARDAARMALAHGDRDRAAALRALAGPGRSLLEFDGRGDGRAVEVLGELATAERVAVLVPGSDTTLDTYDPSPGTRNPTKSLSGAARSLYDETRRQDRDARVAVVAWLGYDAPDTVSSDVLTTGLADEGAAELRAFTGTLRRAAPGARVALLCHSYGAAVCGRAADGSAAADIAFYGSPGTGAADAGGLGTGARVWAGRGSDDWIAHVPHAGPDLFGSNVGLGPDPLDADFGARRFAAGNAGHSDYLRPDSVSLRNLARIARGDAGAVSHG